ncbi:MAG: NAD(P)H-hydrate dehydratase [Candidatus Methanoplasma sp.]|jgi:NAD(P)H-hydrate epimerase|nr:NAD(P)H-hydrate dehydratase [Candidatus Methanoplasma sp.]
MITALDSSVIDANSEAMGIGLPTLMTNAASAIVSVLRSKFPDCVFAFVCGNGNNGGDGIVAAGMMDKCTVGVYLLGSRESIRSEFVREAVGRLECPVKDFSDFDGCNYDILVDCALGTGVRGAARPPYDHFIEVANRFSGQVVSIDVPSGFGTGLSVKPDITITFHDLKAGMSTENSGEIIVKDIGIPKEACENTGPGDMLRYPIPPRDSHKGSNGRLLVIGGGPYYGAPAMSALASMRVGTDIVRLAVPESCSAKVAAFSPVFMVSELEGESLHCGHVAEIMKLTEKFDAVLIGPGLGTSHETNEAVKEIVSSCGVPVVVDADGLTALGKEFVSPGKTVLTPHLGEFKRLGGCMEDIEHSLIKIAKKTKSVILLKGMTDLISDGNRIKRNLAGSPGMTSAGTGDVLAGIVAGLLSKGMDPFDAAALGTFISGKAGEFSFGEKSYGMTATDVIENIPKVLKKYLRR